MRVALFVPLLAALLTLSPASAVPRAQAPAWLLQKQAEGYELDLKLWAGLWMLEREPDGSPRR